MKHVFIFFVFFFQYQIGFACTCIQFETPKIALKKSDVVFIGEVINVRNSKEYWSEEATIIITYHFKGISSRDTITILSDYSGAGCGSHFQTGKEYVIYATKEPFVKFSKNKKGKPHRHIEKRYYTDHCYRTELTSRAQEDVAYLKDRKN